MRSGYWRIIREGGGYIVPGDEYFNAIINGEETLVSVESLNEATDEQLAEYGVEPCTVIGSPPSELLYRPSMSFNGNVVTLVADPLERTVARSRILDATNELKNLGFEPSNTTKDVIRGLEIAEMPEFKNIEQMFNKITNVT